MVTLCNQVPFYQYHHLDIILFLTTLLLICLTATFFFWRTVFRSFSLILDPKVVMDFR